MGRAGPGAGASPLRCPAHFPRSSNRPTGSPLGVRIECPRRHWRIMMSRARALRDLRAAPLALLALLAGSLPTAGAAFAVPSERQASAAELYVAPGAPAGGNGTVEQLFCRYTEHRAAGRRRRGRRTVAAGAAVRRLVFLQEPEGRPVPGRLRRRQRPGPATGPVAVQGRTRHQPGLHPPLTRATKTPARTGGSFTPHPLSRTQ